MFNDFFLTFYNSGYSYFSSTYAMISLGFFMRGASESHFKTLLKIE